MHKWKKHICLIVSLRLSLRRCVFLSLGHLVRLFLSVSVRWGVTSGSRVDAKDDNIPNKPGDLLFEALRNDSLDLVRVPVEEIVAWYQAEGEACQKDFMVFRIRSSVSVLR